MAELDHTSPEYAAVADRYQRVEHEFRTRDGYSIEAEVGSVLMGWASAKKTGRAGPKNSPAAGRCGWRWPSCCLQKPNLLLLDEPTNHLDLEARNWLEEYLHELSARLRADLARPLFPRRHGRQDRRDLEQASLVLHRQLRQVPGAEDAAQRAIDGGLHATSATASSNSRSSSTASATRPPRPSRCRAASRSWRRSSASRFRRKRRPSTFLFRSPSPADASWPNSKDVAKSYRENTAKQTKKSSATSNFMIERGDRIALVGVNGAGKSTLIKLLAGTERVTHGEYRLGHNVKPIISRRTNTKNSIPTRACSTIWATPRPARRKPNCAACWDAFLFSEDDVFKKIGVLSGGERDRYALLRLLLHPANFLLLDEPTNHLDMRAKDVLLERADEIHRHGRLRLARPLLHRQAGDARLRNRRRQGRSLPRQLRRLSVAQAGRTARRAHAGRCSRSEDRSRKARVPHFSAAVAEKWGLRADGSRRRQTEYAERRHPKRPRSA